MDNMTVYKEVAENIIRHQESIIGPIAVERATNVNGLKLDWTSKKLDFVGDPKSIIAELVDQYKTLFGQISVEVCKEAAAPFISGLSQDDIPAVLQ
jgi:hypothetical protein